MKKEFLCVYEYGMGAGWIFIKANSKNEILAKYPKLEVLDGPPGWMSESDVEYTIAKKEMFDLETGNPPDWLKIPVSE